MDINSLEPNRSDMVDYLTSVDLEAHCMLIVNTSASNWHTNVHHDSSETKYKSQKVSGGPNSGNLCLFPKINGVIPLISLGNYQAQKN